MSRPNSSLPRSKEDSPSKSEMMLELGYKEAVQLDAKSSRTSKLLRWWINTLRPACFTKSSALVLRKQVHHTAYLDGLRGFAAFVVYWHHHQLWPRAIADIIFENAYGYENRYYFACLPGVRTFFTGGHFAVAVFFVISGYVLSAKPLNLIYAGEKVKLGDNLGSALFRRWLRLYIPLFVLTFCYMTSWHAFGIYTVSPEHEENYRKELWNWYTKIKNFSFVFKSGEPPWFHYGFHLWSIPVEFQGSIVIFTTLMAFSRLKRNHRLLYTVGLILYFTYIVDGSYMAMFTSGLLLCELDLLARNNNLPRFIARLEPYKTPIFYGLFLASIFLSGAPSHSNDLQALALSPGWYYLSKLKPQAVMDYKWFYLLLAAVFLTSSIPRIRWLKSFFETPFNQYLGRISFALYLVHGPLLWTLGDRIYVATGWYRPAHVENMGWWINLFPLSQKGPLGLEPSFLIPHLILLPINLWVAEVLTKLLDEPSIRFAQWLYRSSLEDSQ